MENLTPELFGQAIAKIAAENPSDIALALKESGIDTKGKNDLVAELFKHIATNKKLQEEVAGMIQVRVNSKFSNFEWGNLIAGVGGMISNIGVMFGGTDSAAAAAAAAKAAAEAKAKTTRRVFLYVGIGVGVVALVVTAIIIIKKSKK